MEKPTETSTTKPDDEKTVPPEASEEESYALTRTVHAVRVACAMCGHEGDAELIVAGVGPYRFPWLKTPPGWWVLCAFTEFEIEKPNGGMMFRCPRCLKVPTKQTSERPPPPRGPHSPRRPRRRRGARR